MFVARPSCNLCSYAVASALLIAVLQSLASRTFPSASRCAFRRLSATSTRRAFVTSSLLKPTRRRLDRKKPRRA
jgi:hypothetical protein